MRKVAWKKQYKAVCKWVRSHTALSVVLVALALFGFLYGVRQYVQHPLSGDEPHYLLMDYSVVHDRDLDLKNNYQNFDYFRYYPAPTPDHASPLNKDRPFSGWYSFHGAGLPLLMLPAFLWNERTGPMLVMLLLATTVLLLTWWWTWLLTKNARASLAATVLLAASYFFNGLSGYIYPDFVTAGLLLAALIILQRYYTQAVWQAVFAGLLVAMAFVHAKSLAIALPLGGIMLYKAYKQQKRIPWSMFVVGVPFALLFFWVTHRWFGTWNPAGIYPTYLGMVSPFSSIPASLWDVRRGLFVYNPALLLILCGVPLWWRAHRQSLSRVAIAIVPAYVITMSFSEWWGGYAPLGRYLMDFVPALMPAVAFFLLAVRTRYQKLLVGLLVLASLVVTVFATRIRLRYPGNEPRAVFFSELEKRVGFGFDRLLPQYTLHTELVGRYSWLKTVVGMLIALAFVWYGYRLARQQPVSHKKVTAL
jgi:hypothetical protein